MTQLTEGTLAPDFILSTHLGSSISLADLQGKKSVLYFYPKADTSGCTKEACAFEEKLADFKRINVPVVGISRDPVKKLVNFAQKYDLTFPLASDDEGKVTQTYGVWVEKSMYGRKYMGIERTTFLIDEQGRIIKIWHKVKVTGHVEAVLETLRNLNQ